MIVHPTTEGWEVIFQRAHELLALQLAYHWKAELRPKRWIEVLSAISDHDNEQEGWKANRHLNKKGAPLDFSLQDFSLQQARGVTEAARYKSSMVRLMISMHTSFLYERLRGQAKETDAFLDEQQEVQKIMRSRLSFTKKEARQAYAVVQWADRCSLILCRQELPADERKLEIFHGPEGTTHYIFQRNDQSVGVTPWCFQENEFRVRVEYRRLKQLKFSSDKALAEALLATEPKEREWVFKEA